MTLILCKYLVSCFSCYFPPYLFVVNFGIYTICYSDSRTYWDVLNFSDDPEDLSNAAAIDDFLHPFGDVIDNKGISAPKNIVILKHYKWRCCTELDVALLISTRKRAVFSRS